MSEASWHDALPAADLPPGKGKSVTVAGLKLALFNAGGTFHAIDDACPHAQGPLGQGWLSGSHVSCPWHGWRFDVTSGACAAQPSARVGCYRVRELGGVVQVQVEPAS